MKNKLLALLGFILLSTALASTAQQFGGFNYTSDGLRITITGYYGSGGAVTIPATIAGRPVTTIGSQAFFNKYSLTSVTLPASITSIRSAAFAACVRLTAIIVNAPNPFYSSADGILFNADRTTLIQCPGGKAGSYVIPSTVTSIGNSAFSGCTSLTNVTIPGSVTNLGSGSFASCTGLIAINVDPANVSYSSLDGVLFNADRTTLLQCPIGKAGTYAVPGSVTNLGSGAFAYCTSLTNVTIPGSVASIGWYAFSYCANLISVTMLSGVTSIGDGAFYNCASLTSFTMLNGVTSIGDSAFYNCTSLTSATIPGSVASIGSSAFIYCANLTNVAMLNGVASIGYRAFFECTSLTSVTIPGSITSMGDSAFYNCSSLTSVTMSDGVTSIGNDAFDYCTSLINITIPGSVTIIGYDAFYNCTNLTGVFFKGNAPSGGGLFNGNSPTVYYLPGATGWGATFAGEPTRLWNPLMQSSGVGPAGFGFNITGTEDIPIVIEAATSLANGNWAPLQTLNLTNGAFHFTDPNWTNCSVRFYRIRSP